MSDLFKTGFSVGVDYNDPSGKSLDQKTTAVTDDATSSENARIIKKLDELYSAGNYSMLAVMLDGYIEERSVDSNCLHPLTQWLFQDDRCIAQDDCYRSSKKCIEALNRCLEMTGDFAIISDLKTRLRTLKRNHEQKSAVISSEKQSLLTKLADNMAESATLDSTLKQVERDLEAAMRQKDRASTLIESRPKTASFSFAGGATTGAAIGGVGLVIATIVTFNWDMHAALLYFILGIPFAGIVGAIIGGIIGAIVGGVASGVNSGRQTEIELSAKKDIAKADETISEMTAEKNSLINQQQSVKDRDATIHNEIAKLDDALLQEEDLSSRANTLICLCEELWNQIRFAEV